MTRTTPATGTAAAAGPAAAALRALLLLLMPALVLAASPLAAADPVDPTWPPEAYNPRPAADDVLLALPCGGAMAFRAVPTPVLAQRYPVTGPFGAAGNAPYLLIGEYEVTRLQAQALAADAEGQPCPVPGKELQRPETATWWQAVALADRWSLWLAANAAAIPDCTGDASPCLPRVDGVPAFVRLPSAAEWEYAARGGLAVAAEAFAAARYPMPEGLNRHAWWSQNARGVLQPIDSWP